MILGKSVLRSEKRNVCEQIAKCTTDMMERIAADMVELSSKNGRIVRQATTNKDLNQRRFQP